MTKIKFKIGQFEIECEGTEEFIKNDFPTVISSLKSLSDTFLPSLGKAISAPITSLPANTPMTNISGTTTSLAARMKVNSAPDLIIAAAAKMTFSDNKDSFSREDLHNEIKTAAGFYKKTHSSNFSQNLISLLKASKLNEVQKNIFSLSATSREAIELTISQ
jgi:hypothetical protein